MIDVELLRSKGAVQFFNKDGYYILVDIDYFATFLNEQIKERGDDYINDNIGQKILLKFILDNRNKFKSYNISRIYDQMFDDIVIRKVLLELLAVLMKTEMCVAYNFENKTFHEIKITTYFDKTFERDGFVKGNKGTRFYVEDNLIINDLEIRYF